jgi:hypothetical protein
MRTLISIAFFWCMISCFAQGNLQLNQVKLVTTVETVPVGKVWKIESALTGEERYPTSGTTLASNSRFILVNGTSICVHEEHVATTGVGFNGCCGGGFWMSNVGMAVNSTTPVLVQVTAQPTKLPLWLPAGTTLAAGTKVSAISVLEFNIIP